MIYNCPRINLINTVNRKARLKGIYIVWFYSIEKDNIYLQVRKWRGEE